MTQKASLNIEMPGVDFAGMAREAIAAKLTESLTGDNEIITKIVAAALATKVNSNGVVDARYSYENKTPYAEWLAQQMIREATLDVMKAKVEQLRPELEKLIEQQLSKNTKSIAACLTESFVKNVRSGYGFKFEVQATVQPVD